MSRNQLPLLIDLLKNSDLESILIFTQMKHAADKLARSLSQAGIRTEAIHGNKSQNARQAALKSFKNKGTRVLVATDIAARGIDIDELTHVLNFELPNTPETYVHRIGRTGRAGAGGNALSFCDRSERVLLSDIQKLIKKTIPVVKGHIFDGYGAGVSEQTNPTPTVKLKSAGKGRRFSRAFAAR